MTSIASATALNGQPYARDASCFCVEVNADSYFGRTTAGCKERVEVDITCDGKGVGKVTVYFVEEGPRRRIVHTLGLVQAVRKVKYLERRESWTTANKRYALVSEFFDVEKSAASADVGFPKIFDAVDDGGANLNSECDTIVIRLADTSNGGNVGPLKDVLSCIYNKRR